METCSKCNKGEMRVGLIDMRAPIGGVMFVGKAHGSQCSHCGERWFSPQSFDAFWKDAAKNLATHGPMTGKTFMAIRKALPLTAVETAVLLDVSAETISRWETGERDVPRSAWISVSELLLHPADRARIAAMKSRPPEVHLDA